jgi:hypothetical protein
MTTTRRSLFGIVGAALAAAFALDPDKALWVPGKKTISIPKANVRPELIDKWADGIIVDAMTYLGLLRPGMVANSEAMAFGRRSLGHLIAADVPVSPYTLAANLAPVYRVTVAPYISELAHHQISRFREWK